VGLQVARTDKLGHLTRAQAHEVGNFTGNWNMVAFAVCALPPRGFVVPPFGESPERGSQTVKTATASCPGTTKLLSAGGAVTNVAPGFATLQSVIPLNDRQARAVAVSSMAEPPVLGLHRRGGDLRRQHPCLRVRSTLRGPGPRL
jgi:hypothetical protein